MLTGANLFITELLAIKDKGGILTKKPLYNIYANQSFRNPQLYIRCLPGGIIVLFLLVCTGLEQHAAS